MAIQDFGEKIGGARKDLWGKRGLNLDDINDFNVAERDQYIKKNNIWIKPDYAKLLNDEGYSRNALYFIKTLRDSLPTAPEIRYSDSPETIKEKQDAYVAFINEFKKDIMEVKTDKDIEKMGTKYLVDKGYVQKGRLSYEYVGNSEAFINRKFFKAIQADSYKIAQEAKKKNFLGDELKGQMANFSILEVDGQSVKLDMNRLQNESKLVLTQQVGVHYVRYLYPNSNELNDIELYQHGTHIVLDDHRIIFAGSKEAAEEFLTEKAQNIIDVKNAITQAVNSAGKEATKEINKDIKRKRPLVPPTLAHIRRNGPDVRRRNAVGQDFIDQFHIRGGEFGNCATRFSA
ncbi:MAG: hypothetical protein UIM53_06065 [Acutalibacteraceae bacterium]|nr:hypothetical protein [Acutalibacteraceae bacterium]